MSELSLHLRHLAAPVREPVAWFIAGADVALWISEICRWNISQENLRLYVLPRGLKDRMAAGVLVVPPANAKLCCVPRALGFGVLAGKLYLPVDADLSPPVEPNELKLVHEVQAFHPAIGLVGFEPSDARTVADLLRPPPSRVENWNFARPAPRLNARLHSVQLLTPITLEALFGDAPKEIGSEPIQDLPPAPDEPSNSAARKLLSDADRRLAKALHSFLRRLPHTGQHRTWVNDLEDWAAARLQQIAQDLDRIRHKEIHRLLDLLDKDPDQGLRHALPMSRLLHRGQAPPSVRLGTHDADFNLNRLRGGQPADIWHLGPDLQLRLRAKYQELANRELQLGHFRRASYIFAELLGDFEAAASALKQGRHFREAAVLYKDYLHRPREAAVCLAEGGLLLEAITIYEHEKLFLEAGDLYARLGQVEQAAAAYELEVQRRQSDDDRLGAAQLLEEKLASPERALTMLSDAWPHSSQAAKCLAAEFDLLARQSWHPRAAARLEQLRAENTRPDLIATLARVLAAQSAHYPDRAVRHAASDLVRVKASQRLEAAATTPEFSTLADALIKLAPQDRLLARDVFRFGTLRNQRLRSAKASVVMRQAAGPILIRTIELPKKVLWHTVKSCGGYFFAAGNGVQNDTGQNHLFLVRGDWEGRLQTLRWASPILSSPPLLLEFDEEISRPACIFVTPGPARPLIHLPEIAFPAADRFAGVLPAGSPGWLPDDLLALCTRGQMAWLLRDGIAECRDLHGKLLSSIGLAGVFAELPGALLRSSLLVQRDFMWVAAAQRLFLFRQGKMLGTWTAEADIASLVPSAPNLPLCVAVRLEKGVSLHWPDKFKERTDTLCAELMMPLATFTADGTLVLVAGHEGRLCDVHQHGQSLLSAFTLLRGAPIAVVRADGPNQFAVFSSDGKAQLFRTS